MGVQGAGLGAGQGAGQGAGLQPRGWGGGLTRRGLPAGMLQCHTSRLNSVLTKGRGSRVGVEGLTLNPHPHLGSWVWQMQVYTGVQVFSCGLTQGYDCSK
jgi:hypothetical protein